MKKFFTIFMACLLIGSLLFGLVACSDKDKDKQPTDEAYTVTDSYKRIVTFNKVPDRIISWAPSNTEIVFALGQSSKLIGRTNWCDYPAAAANVGVVFDYSSINHELVMATVGNNKDSTVILATVYHLSDVVTLADMGYKILILDAQNLEDVFNSMSILNQAMGGNIDGYDAYIKSLRDRVDAVTSKITASTSRVSVVHIVSTGFWVSGNKTLENDIINIAGGINVAVAGDEGYYEANNEAFIAFNPTVIVYTTNMGSDWGVYDALTSTPYNNMAAVKDSQTYSIDGNLSSRSGPRAVDALEAYAKILHPEIFGPYTV